MEGNMYEDIFGAKSKRPAINSRAKGCRNENDLCKLFLAPWTNEKFARTPRSGGLGWGVEFASGDVVNLTRGGAFEFVVETKHYAKLSLTKILRENSVIYNFWFQAKRDADKVGKLPLLAVRENGMKKGDYVVFFNEDVTRVLKSIFNIPYKYKGVYKVDNSYIFGFNSSVILEVDYCKLIEEVKKNG
jgi:hypothetical protein